DTVRGVENRPEQIRGAAQVFERELHEQRLAGFAGPGFFADAFVVSGGFADRLVEDGRVRRETGHRKLVDVAAQGSVVENLARDIVKPKPLAEVVQLLGLVHDCSFIVAGLKKHPTQQFYSVVSNVMGMAESARASDCASPLRQQLPLRPPAPTCRARIRQT